MQKSFQRTLGQLCAAAVLALGASSAFAQAYPTKSLKFIVPFPAGSATDNVGRIVAHAMSEALGQSISVENKAGANGILGAEAVKAAAGDPYTFLVTTNTTQAANVSLYKKLSYDPVKDFTPIGKIGLTGFVLMVKNDFPAKDVKEFISYAKANAGKMSFGQGSAGSLVSAAMFNQMAGVQAVNVPYRGIPPALTDLLGGQLQYAFADVGNAAAQIRGGNLRGLGVTTAKRAGRLPQVPAIGDTVPGYDISAWFGLMAPAGIPADVAKKLSDTLQTVLAKPEVREKLANAGIDMAPEDSATLARTIDNEIKKWSEWVKTAGIAPE
jgi:tripartite-type tricarboxylate transporter receptor subunit TctC